MANKSDFFLSQSCDRYQFEPTGRTVKITPDQLVFADTHDVLDRVYPNANIPTYQVCSITTDRARDWNLFVMVGATDTEFEIICPRILVNVDQDQYPSSHPLQTVVLQPGHFSCKPTNDEVYELFLGQDNMVEQDPVRQFKPFGKCVCRAIEQGDCFDCDCAFSDSMIIQYAATFQRKDTPEYAVVKVPKELPGYQFYMAISKSAFLLKGLNKPYVY